MIAWEKHDSSFHPEQKWVEQNQISPYMYLAVIAGEDQKFPYHWGFDLDAIQEAISNHNTDKPIRGASTLSQQTAKNLFLWESRSWLRKGAEALLTLSLELSWSKERILTVYLNIVEFGNGIFGIEAAANHFFHKPASQLTKEECALLAAVLPNPHRFKVNAPDDYTQERQQWILKQMWQLGGLNYLKELKK